MRRGSTEGVAEREIKERVKRTKKKGKKERPWYDDRGMNKETDMKQDISKIHGRLGDENGNEKRRRRERGEETATLRV